MKRFVFLALFAVVGGMVTSLYAQNHPLLEAARIPPREDDHFWRRKVVNRIDLRDKINVPLVTAENPQFYTGGKYGETQGLVPALINGLKSGKYLAYHPDSLTKALSYEDVLARAQQMNSDGSGGGGDDWGDDFGGGGDEFDAGDDFGGDEWGDFGDDFGGGGDFDDLGGGTDAGAGASASDFDYGPFTEVVEFIEDRIFDKNRSDMVYDIQYIRLVWVDPAETLPDKLFIAFKYGDVLETLEDTQWKNKYNDAEYRNMREIFELRLFNSYIIYVSGRGAKTLEESEFRRTQIVEFEHHLWSY